MSKLQPEGGGKLTLKETFVKHGRLAICIHVGLSIATFAGFYAAISSGVDVKRPLRAVGLLDDPDPATPGGVEAEAGALGEASTSRQVVEALGASGPTMAAAYVCNKAMMPVRAPITVALTPIVARWLHRLRTASK
mmetsp:Transcript_17841/g.45265  ORF Transcript_17841/g.45265 Transcript_17841/m.45265 type:complete len:136 (-) Transcript_17841:442-849(-)